MGAFTELTAGGKTELEVRPGVELRLRVRVELSMTLLLGIVEPDVSVKSVLENAMECPRVDEAFPPMAFLSSSTLGESPPPVFPSSGTR